MTDLRQRLAHVHWLGGGTGGGTERLTGETSSLGLTGVAVEVGTTEDELVDRVAGLFGLGHPVGR